jgi:hypothetical protein
MNFRNAFFEGVNRPEIRRNQDRNDQIQSAINNTKSDDPFGLIHSDKTLPFEFINEKDFAVL